MSDGGTGQDRWGAPAVPPQWTPMPPPPGPGGAWGAGPPGPDGAPPAPPAPARPSRRGLVVGAAVAAVVVLVGVGVGAALLLGGDDGPVELTAAERGDALLRPVDVGPGYREDSTATAAFLDQMGSVPSAGIDAPPACDALLEEARPAAEPLAALESLTGLDVVGDSGGALRKLSGDGTTVIHGLAPDRGQLDLLRRLLAACGEVTIGEPPARFGVTITEDPAVDVGDDALAYTVELAIDVDMADIADELPAGMEVPDELTTMFEGLTFATSYVAWTRDGTASVVGALALPDEPGEDPSLDPELLPRLAREADERLAEVIEGAR